MQYLTHLHISNAIRETGNTYIRLEVISTCLQWEYNQHMYISLFSVLAHEKLLGLGCVVYPIGQFNGTNIIKILIEQIEIVGLKVL